MSELDVIGALRGTDKSSTQLWSWDYLRHYEDMFSRWRHSDINLIEIGVAGGASLSTWHWFFDKAKIVGIDINPDCIRFARDRIVVRIGSQEDPSFLSKIAAEYPPTIIIDDGSHLAHHMIASFEALFPQLRPGGIYIFEDLSFHFEDGGGQWQGFKAHQGLSDQSIYDYLSRFIRARAANAKTPKGAWGFSRYAFEQIDSVVTFGGVVALRKRAAPDFEGDVEVFEREMRRDPENTVAPERYAHYLFKNNVHQDRAAALLRDVLRANPQNAAALTELVHVASRLERFEEAAEIAGRLARLSPADRQSWQLLADAERHRKRPDLEMSALKRLAEFPPPSHQVHSRLSSLLEQAGDLGGAIVEARKASAIAPGAVDLANRVKHLEARSAGSP